MADKPVGELIEEARARLIAAERALRAAIGRMPDSPRRGRLIQERWQVWQMLGQDRFYASQAGQDEYLDRVVFGRKRNGVFAEIGAYDGVTGSNSLFFEAFRGWTGLMVEASPTYHARAAANRVTPCINVAVAETAGEVRFLDIRKGYTQMGGIVDWLGEVARKAIEADPRTEAEEVVVPARPLADILAEAGLRRIDYLSIDIEGGELPVLRGFPFGEFDITAWSIEVNEETPEIGEIMRRAGYALAAHIGVDQIWRRAGP